MFLVRVVVMMKSTNSSETLFPCFVTEKREEK
jgi:hypothetical protein